MHKKRGHDHIESVMEVGRHDIHSHQEFLFSVDLKKEPSPGICSLQPWEQL